MQPWHKRLFGRIDPTKRVVEGLWFPSKLRFDGGISSAPGLPPRDLVLAPAGQADYASSSDADRDSYGWLCDELGLMPNGDRPYRLTEN